MFRIYNMSNLDFEASEKFDIVFADYIYESADFNWAVKQWHLLKDNGLMIAMCDYHTNFRFRMVMEDILQATFVNDLVWKNEWGRSPSNRMHQCYDNIIIYCKGNKWKFYPDRIQVPKATANSKGLNPSGRTTKTATAWIDDIVLTTVAKERVKKKDGHLLAWQKPLRLYDRVILPFSDENDLILDSFMGSGSLGRWCMENNRQYVGIENDPEIFRLAEQNIFGS